MMRLPEMPERFTFQSAAPVPVSVTIARVGATATATSAAAHGFVDGDFITIGGATPAAYNGEFPIDATAATTFTYPVAGSPATPPTGTITAVFTSDAGGGQRESWATVATVWGAMQALSGQERLAAQALGTQLTYRATVLYRADLTESMRLQWTPYRESVARTLEIHAILPHDKYPRELLTIECGEVP